jgi:hypothetical protein
MLLEQHIEELKLELREAIDPAERREMEIELELARAELAVIIAEQEGAIDAEPPYAALPIFNRRPYGRRQKTGSSACRLWRPRSAIPDPSRLRCGLLSSKTERRH